MNILAPSILSIDFGHMERELIKVYDAGATTIHFDVMDGSFVPNLSFGIPVLRFVRKALPEAILDVHMMVVEPIHLLEAFVKAGADIITVHYEAVSDLKRYLDKIHSLGIKAGVAISPATQVSVLQDYIDDIDMILVMSVEPGFGGQEFHPETYDKLREAKALAQKSGTHTDIEVDGGIDLNNLKDVLDAGGNVIVAGSKIFKNDSVANVKAFLEIME